MLPAKIKADNITRGRYGPHEDGEERENDHVLDFWCPEDREGLQRGLGGDADEDLAWDHAA